MFSIAVPTGHQQRHAIFYKDRLRRLADGHAYKRDDVAERVAHQTGGERAAKWKSIRWLDAARPGEGADHVARAGNRKNEDEAGAESLNVGEDLTDARAAHEVRKQKQAQQTEDDTK